MAIKSGRTEPTHAFSRCPKPFENSNLPRVRCFVIAAKFYTLLTIMYSREFVTKRLLPFFSVIFGEVNR